MRSKDRVKKKSGHKTAYYIDKFSGAVYKSGWEVGKGTGERTDDQVWPGRMAELRRGQAVGRRNRQLGF